MTRVLVVDDDTDTLRLITLHLRNLGYEVSGATSAEQALALLGTSLPHLIITDMRMGGMDGMQFFSLVEREHPALPVIIVTSHGTIADAIAATRQGISGYLAKPIDANDLQREVKRALAMRGLLAESAPGDWRGAIITRNPLVEQLLADAHLVAQGDASVLIAGASGTGKELLARAIHAASPRRTRAFVAINCAAIPEQLLESELFGHVKGAFTGAAHDHRGLFEAAAGGTLLLDEIGEMSQSLQVKILRALQEREVRRVGSTGHVRIDVRVISATNRDLRQEIAAGRFREDLYYRLHVVGLELPSLSERREDIPLLASHFLIATAARYRKAIRGFEPECVPLLVAAPWPGNVRQLQNTVEKCVALCASETVPVALVQRAISGEGEELATFDDARRQFERAYLTRVLKITGGNVTQAARLANRNRSDFYSLLSRHELEPARFKDSNA